MVSLRRFGPLIAIAFIGLAVLLVRMFQVQVIEHNVWAVEAVNLVREGTIEPYQRGRIYDRKGRLFVRDEDVYELHFVWRNFRRQHALGQVAQARSLLLMRPASLTETRANLESWALELIELSPEAIDEFGRGHAIRLGAREIPGSSDPALDRRGSRSADLHYYVKELLGFERKENADALKRRSKPDWDLPYVELIARLRKADPDQVRAALVVQLDAAQRHLLRLSELLQLDDEDLAGTTHLERLLSVIERARRRAEDAAAGDLFRQATGFGAWRLSAVNLACIDLDWLRLCLYWDDARLLEWMQAQGAAWPDAVDDYLAGRAIALFKVGKRDEASNVLDGLAEAFATPRVRRDVRGLAPYWRELSELVVLSELDDLFEGVGGDLSRAEREVLPFQTRELRRDFARTEKGIVSAALRDIEDSGACAEELLRLASNEHPVWQPAEVNLVATVLHRWDELMQNRIGEIFARFGGGDAPRLAIRRPRLKHAIEERAYIVRDRSARAHRLGANPDYELVHLVTRYPERYSGFIVRSTTRRVPVAFDSEDVPLPVAHKLIGTVRTPYLRDLLEQRGNEVERRELERRLRLTKEDGERITRLVSESFHSSELLGGTGIEGYFQPVLSGKNGYRETQGLQDKKEGNRAPINQAPIDGHDLYLTLDLDLQKAAQWHLMHPPAIPAGDLRPDLEWSRNPVGAIVLITPEGDVRAAASTPTRLHAEGGRHQDGQRKSPNERTLRQFVFQPPGSVVKPLVAAWAMQYQGLDADAGVVKCEWLDEKGAGWGKVHCHNTGGHSGMEGTPIDLHLALRKSCNSYFAFLGNEYFERGDFREMFSAFGFGRPTGVRSLENPGRGLREDFGFDPRSPLAQDSKRWTGTESQRSANGLVTVTATPMQVARAYAGLLTGALPELRLHAPLPGLERERNVGLLPFDPHVLETVHGALDEVVNQLGGSAYGKGLGEDTLGFRLRAKTGSADYHRGMVPDYAGNSAGFVDGMRKHTWIAGWFPAEDPKLIVVAYVHDTATTSSHGVVHLLSAFLQDAAVQNYLAEEGR